MISFIHHSNDHVLKSFVGDDAEDCQLFLFCDAGFAGDLTDSKSTSGAILCLAGPNTFAPLSWICKTQGAVSHSSTEAELIAMDAGMRLEALPALMLWETILDVMNPVPQETTAAANPTAVASKTRLARGNSMQTDFSHAENDELITLADYKTLLNVDWVPPSLPPPSGRGRLLICEDNNAVIAMCINGRSPNMRHVPRTHRVNLDWLFERLLQDPSINIAWVSTKHQLADIFTKGSFSEQTWKELSMLVQIAPTSYIAVSSQATIALSTFKSSTTQQKTFRWEDPDMSNPGKRIKQTSATTPEAVLARAENAPPITIGELPTQKKTKQGEAKKNKRGKTVYEKGEAKKSNCSDEDGNFIAVLPAARGGPEPDVSSSSAGVTTSESRDDSYVSEQPPQTTTEATQINASRVETPKKHYDSQPLFEASASSMGAAVRAQAKPQPTMMARQTPPPQKEKTNKNKAPEEEQAAHWEEVVRQEMAANAEASRLIREEEFARLMMDKEKLSDEAKNKLSQENHDKELAQIMTNSEVLDQASRNGAM